MQSNKIVKVIGIVGPLLGAVASCMTNWVGKKDTEATIAKQVAEALAQEKAKES